MATEFLTGIFKLHKPSARRRTVLDHVLEQYTLGVASVLDWSLANLSHIEEAGTDRRGKYTGSSISKVLPKASSVEADIASCLRESVISRDGVGAMLASYFELRGTDEDTGFPIARDPSPTGWVDTIEDVLDEMGILGNDLLTENQARSRLARQARSNVMPVQFVRSRDFAILTNKAQTGFFIWLKLLPNGHELAQPIKPQGDLVEVGTGEIFNYKGSSAILFPLEVGRHNGGWGWQYHRFIEPVLAEQATPQTAKLVRENDDYYVHITFAFKCPDPYEPETYLGIDRGVFYSMAYGMVDRDGQIILMGHNEDGFRSERIAAGKKVQEKQRKGQRVTAKDWKGRSLDGILHTLANDMIALALEHRSQIVLEDLNIRIGGKFYKSAWKKMHKILEYKCKLAGVPFRRGGIWAAYSSQICIYCGGLNEDRKRDGSPFICPWCGAVYHSDEGAGVNISRRVLYRKKEWEKRGGYRAFHRSFANEAVTGARIDLRELEGVQMGFTV